MIGAALSRAQRVFIGNCGRSRLVLQFRRTRLYEGAMSMLHPASCPWRGQGVLYRYRTTPSVFGVFQMFFDRLFDDCVLLWLGS